VPLQQELAPAEAGGAPGVDGQDFAAIEAYGVERWLAELALALREETYRPEPIRRVFIPNTQPLFYVFYFQWLGEGLPIPV
jgi:hypothetical protein